MTLTCLTCGGVYADVLPDGLLYFHACPPLSDSEVGVKLGLPADAATWSPVQRQQVAAYPRARSNHRDENRPGTRAIDHNQLKAAGQGVREVAS